MKCLGLTLPNVEENFACDEALLELCESADSGAVLRSWEPTTYCVVVGYSNRVASEVRREVCRKRGN